MLFPKAQSFVHDPKIFSSLSPKMKESGKDAEIRQTCCWLIASSLDVISCDVGVKKETQITPVCPAAAVCVSTLGVHRSREETGVVCFLDPVLTPLQAFVRLSFISTSWTSDWREYFTFAVYINNLYFHVSWTLICHLLISSCLWILPLLLSRKDTWVSLYCVMTSTNFLDSTVCWGQVGKHEDVTLEVHFMAAYKWHIVFRLA